MAAKRSSKKTTSKKKSAKKAAPKKAKSARAKPAAKRAKPAAKKKAPAKKAPAAKAKAPAPPKAASASKSRFVWVDLVTKDVAAAQSFYKSLMGWGTKDVDVAPPMNKYTMFNFNGEDFGGVIPLPMPEAPVSWLPYVWVENVDEVVKRVGALGGKVVAPAMDIPNVGRFAVIEDPTGGVVSPMSFLQPPRPQPERGLVGPVAWEELLTSDTGKAGVFYQELFGWGRNEMDMGPNGKYHIFKAGDRDAGGMGALMPAIPASAWVTYFAVEDVDSKTETAKGMGATQLVPPSDIPNVGRFSWLKDPQGALFALFKGAPGGM
jgi:uncharacterized protein